MRRWMLPVLPLAWILLAAMMLSCSPSDGAMALQSNEPELVTALHPAEGSVAVRGEVPIAFGLGEAAPGELPAVTLSSSESEWTPQCTMSEDGAWVSCEPVSGLPYDESFDLVLDFGAYRTAFSFTSDPPERGRAFELSSRAEVAPVGGSLLVSAALTRAVEDAGIIGVVVDDRLWLGQASEGDDGDLVIEEPGLTFNAPVVFGEDGRFQSERADALLPITLEGRVLPALVEGCRISGRLTDEGLASLRITGWLSRATLERLAEPLGVAGELAMGSIELNVDSDGDGVADAAALSLSSNAPDATLKAWR